MPAGWIEIFLSSILQPKIWSNLSEGPKYLKFFEVKFHGHDMVYTIMNNIL